jgi:uncharacterized membrane protein YedE/YeeE
MNLNAIIDPVVERLGEAWTLTLLGVGVGVLFGFFAQRSRFCLRSAVIEFARNVTGGKLTVWLFAFSAAVLATQAFTLAGWLDASGARPLAARGSLSGAVIGGAMFGIGMILARGCSSRLLVLTANGNLRALLSGLVFAVTAQAALVGLLAPLRMTLTELWTIDGGASRDLLALTGIGHAGALLFGGVWLVAAVFWARRQGVSAWGWAGGAGAGLMVALAWLLTYQVSRHAFEVVPVQSLSFTGPSSDFLMLVLSPPGRPLKFDLGLIPCVFLGSFIAAALFGELKLEGFEGGRGMRRYIARAMLMGFGGMLAGGCAVGAGLSGASVFALTAWATLASMWAAAAATDRLVDMPAQPGHAATPKGALPVQP